jgi:hypothetical protein
MVLAVSCGVCGIVFFCVHDGAWVHLPYVYVSPRNAPHESNSIHALDRTHYHGHAHKIIGWVHVVERSACCVLTGK